MNENLKITEYMHYEILSDKPKVGNAKTHPVEYNIYVHA